MAVKLIWKLKMPLAFDPLAVPLYSTPEGDVRVVGTRIDLEDVVSRFNDGRSPEVIAAMLPTLSLSDAYTTIAFYLRNRKAVDEYVAARESAADAVRAEIEGQSGYQQLRDRLIARASGAALRP